MYLYGASGHGKVIKEIIEANGGCVEAFVDDNPKAEQLMGVPVLHDTAGLSPMIISIGDNAIRKQIVSRLQCRFGTAIHPSAVVSPSATIGEGTVVMPGAVINAHAVIGKHCIINTGASVDHDCVVADYCHLAPHSTLCGGVHVGEGTLIGVGACVIPCMKIGSWCTIGAGSVIINQINNNMKVVGNPAKPIPVSRNKSVGGG